MSGILVVAECSNGDIGDQTAQLVAAAAALGSPTTLGIAAKDVDRASAKGAITRVDEIVTVRLQSDDFDHEVQSAAVRTMIETVRPQVVLMGYTIRAASFGAGIAEALGSGFASDVISISRGDLGELLVVRSLFGGKVNLELEFSADEPLLALLRPGVWKPAAPGGAPPVQELMFDPPASRRVRHRQYRRPEEGVDLKRADVIFTVGRGVGDQQKIQPFAEIAERLGAALGASKPVVDAGWLPAPHQVGQTGVTVKPRLYVAFGVSGALQHLAGMQSSNKIVAINTDPDAAIFGVAHEGAVADIHEVAEHLKVLLGNAGGR